MDLKLVFSVKPESTNHIYLKSKRGVYMSKKGKECKAHIINDTLTQLPADFNKINCDIQMIIELNFADKRRRDIDNYNKILLDAFNGLIYNDDSQITEMTIKKNIGCGIDSINVKINQIKLSN